MRNRYNDITPMAAKYTGRITKVVDDGPDFHIRYETADGARLTFIIQKNDTNEAELITNALGRAVEVSTNRVGMVQRVKIGGQTVLAQ